MSWISRSRLLVLGVLSATMLMTVLDGSIVTVAMPAIQRDLGFASAELSWTVNAYLIAYGGLLLLAGRLGDLIGRRAMFLAGNAVFVAASLLAGAATGPGMLIGARFLQGVGSAMASAVVLGILVTTFTDAGERAKAIGVFSFTGAAGASLGQVIGGVLTDALGWNYIFFINVPIGVVTIVLALRALPADRGLGLSAGADAVGALLVTAGLMLGIYAVVQIERYGPRSLWFGAASLVLLAAFLVRQATARTPLMPLRILRSRAVAGANLVQVLTLGAMFAFQVVVALFMQQVLRYGALDTGLAMLPAALSIAGVSLFASPRLSTRFGARAVLLGGLVLLIGAMAWLTRVPVDARYVTDLLPVMVLIMGGGLVLPALTTLGMSDARSDDAGLVSGVFNTTQQVGMAAGVALLSTVAASRTEGLLAGGASEAVALTGGYRLAFTVSLALLAGALVVAYVVLRRPRAGAEQAVEPQPERV
ncbi:drug resistance transporter, EmrB/QacA subfamily [Microbispora rosea]|uniref:Drug resistance transporter, EmrB/QacA subfamily n=1 Tax=Microbispora rosea TaxID=58117 RepID=A0A1N7GQN7_9ACTN|nr:MFS transporter [Microbispora rosea]GIH47286.1 MFS transporter [Microbispora rosea subsp. rosea]SIS14859.1 drug resistance transporter, EmrB/QacA subfamily [Microbispora rosea]